MRSADKLLTEIATLQNKIKFLEAFTQNVLKVFYPKVKIISYAIFPTFTKRLK